MTDNDMTTLTIDDLNNLAAGRGETLIPTLYRGYTILFSPRTGDAYICDTRTGEQVDVTGLGTSGAKLYIDEWVDEAR